MGTSGEPAYITDTWDPQTGRLTEQDTQVTTAKTSVDDLNYSYDDAGNVKSEADTPSGDSAAADVQCFQYDYLGRLTQAWAQGTAGCAATPSASAEGGPAPYANTYPAAGTAQPHAITTSKATTTSGTTSSYSYDPSGNLTAVTGTSQNQALTWNDNGQLSQDAVPGTAAGSVMFGSICSRGTPSTSAIASTELFVTLRILHAIRIIAPGGGST